ncbi:MAG: HAMP domain-containing histidine kinase [Ramlibacter sp.]|nr:HAMP domain-containing histidine kinase [Ramlibacter sp.]
MKGLGLFTLTGHPLFYWIWGHWLPQPYENIWLRGFTGLTGCLLISNRISNDPSSRLAGQVFSAVFWFELPFLFSWMYLCNSGNTVWLASICAMILSYYYATDWRLATLGIGAGAGIAWTLFQWMGPAVPALTDQQFAINAVVIAFSMSMGLLLGLSSANLRREHLNNTLTTMGIMAHELRTPLATMSLIGDAMRNERPHVPEASAQQLERLAGRLHSLVRNMNHQIDAQIANARLLRLPNHKESVSAGTVVGDALRDYPYRSAREKDSVVLQIRRDFKFAGSRALFSQVINNLVKNALRSLAAANTAAQPGDLLVEVGTLHERGRIVITDRGGGIDPELQDKIFEPFFSTDRGTGHGLGLAFCKRVIQSANGSIRVKSALGQGASFTIELPLLE